MRALHDWEKLKYDEVSMRVSVSELADSACKSTKEKAIVKLLNCTSTHAVIFEVDGEYVTVAAKGPTTIRSIEKNSAESLKASLQRQSSTPSWAREEFETCGRMIIADDHSAISVILALPTTIAIGTCRKVIVFVAQETSHCFSALVGLPT